MSTGETVLILAVVGVAGYLVYQSSKPAAAPPVQPGGYGTEPAPGKYGFYGQVTQSAQDVALELIKAFSQTPPATSQTPPATRTAP